jgi:hypothetical protein
MANVPMLHRFLAIGATLLFLMFLGLKVAGIAPLLREDPELTRTIGYVLTGVVAMMVAVALLVLKPRAPERSPGQSVDQYWATTTIAQKVLMVWLVLEGAAALASVGFALTAEPAVGGVAAIAIATFWMNSPDAFAKPIEALQHSFAPLCRDLSEPSRANATEASNF